MISASDSCKPCRSLPSSMSRIGIDELMSLRLKTVSARSIVWPVETSTARLKVACCAWMIAASPSFTVTISPPAVCRHFSTSSDDLEQTSMILPNFPESFRFIDYGSWLCIAQTLPSKQQQSEYQSVAVETWQARRE